jgi:hypothetical protein
MSGDGGGGPEAPVPGIRDLTAGEIAKREQFVADRKARAARRNRVQDPVVQGVPETDETIAYEEAHAMNRAINRERARGTAEAHILTRVSQRPEFRLTGEPRFALDDISQALERNSFGPTRELLARLAVWPGLELGDLENITEAGRELVAERARELAVEGDDKHFIAVVSFLGEHLRPGDLPEESERSPVIAEALRKHAVDAFRDQGNTPIQILEGLQQFSRLNLLDNDTLSQMPEFRDAWGQRLLASFEQRSFFDYASTLSVCRQLGIPHEPEGQLVSELQNQALSWLEESLTTFERGKDEATGEEPDPMTPLELLSQFMDDPRFMGIDLSEDQVRERPGLLQRVQNTIEKAENSLVEDDSSDEPREAMLESLRDIFGGQNEG